MFWYVIFVYTFDLLINFKQLIHTKQKKILELIYTGVVKETIPYHYDKNEKISLLIFYIISVTLKNYMSIFLNQNSIHLLTFGMIKKRK